MGYQIAKCGGLVVSGLAGGVDTLAMKGALLAEQPGEWGSWETAWM
ncbi:MAG: hypothetical protein ACLU9S_05905 [Oscillospiraceae bacterium]